MYKHKLVKPAYKFRFVDAAFVTGVAQAHRERMHFVAHVCVPFCVKMGDCMLVRSGMKDLCKCPVEGASASSPIPTLDYSMTHCISTGEVGLTLVHQVDSPECTIVTQVVIEEASASSTSTKDYLSAADRAIVNASVKVLREERVYMEQVCAPKCTRWHDCKLIDDGMKDLCKGPVEGASASPLRDPCDGCRHDDIGLRGIAGDWFEKCSVHNGCNGVAIPIEPPLEWEGPGIGGERALWNYTHKGILPDPITGLPRNREEASASSAFEIYKSSRKKADTPFVGFVCTNPGCGLFSSAHIDEVNAGMYKIEEACEFCGSPVTLDPDQESGLSISQTIEKLRRFGIIYTGASASSPPSVSAPNKYNWEWEAHMDCLLAPPETRKVEETKLLYPAPQEPPYWAWEKPPKAKRSYNSSQPSNGALYCKMNALRCKTCTLTTATIHLCPYKGSGVLEYEVNKELFRQSPPRTTKGALPDFWTKSPSPALTNFRDNSRYLGYYDPDSVATRIDDAVINKITWDMARGIPVYKWEYRAYKEDPNTPRHIYVGEDTWIKESELRSISYADQDDDNDGVPYISPLQEARNMDDRDAIAFMPAFIFGPGKPVWSKVIRYVDKHQPYYKLVKHQSIRPIGCKVKIEGGYVLPVGVVSGVTKIKTRADKKRARAFAAIRKELTPYVGVDRAKQMASKEVAAMATC